MRHFPKVIVRPNIFKYTWKLLIITVKKINFACVIFFANFETIGKKRMFYLLSYENTTLYNFKIESYAWIAFFSLLVMQYFCKRWKISKFIKLVKHKALFRRQFNITWTLWMPNGRWNNIVFLQNTKTFLTLCFDADSTFFERYGRWNNYVYIFRLHI